jgi:hypothetical protein
VDALRKELAELHQETKSRIQVTSSQLAGVYPWADKETQIRWSNGIFAAMSLKGVPMGAEMLQQRMRQAGLLPNELTRSLIEAREG